MYNIIKYFLCFGLNIHLRSSYWSIYYESAKKCNQKNVMGRKVVSLGLAESKEKMAWFEPKRIEHHFKNPGWGVA